MNHQRASEHYNNGLQCARDGNWDAAIEFLSKAIADNPGHVNSHNVLGKAYVQKDEISAARKCWQAALKADPDNATARQCLAKAGKGFGQFQFRRLLWPALVVISLSALIIVSSVLLVRIGNLETKLAAATTDQITANAPVLLDSTAQEAVHDESDMMPEKTAIHSQFTRPPQLETELAATTTDQITHDAPILLDSTAQEAVHDESDRITEETAIHSPATIPPQLENDSQVTEAYRQALADCRSQHYSPAMEVFLQILRYSGPHDLKDNAQYWLAECYYAQREYAQALEEFQRVKGQFPESNKIFDAELKVAYSYYNLGHIQEAQEQFLQLTEDWPQPQYRSRLEFLSQVVQSGQTD